MVTCFLAILFVFFSFLLETSCLYMYADLSIPLSLMALLFCSLKYGSILAQMLGFILGCLVDVVSGTPIGFSSLSYVSIAFVIASLSRKGCLESCFFLTLCFILARLLQTLISFGLASFFQADPWQSLGWPQGFFLGLLINPVYIHFLNMLSNFFNGRRLPKFVQ